MKFTGHERDLASPAGAGDDLDYMHARFCSPLSSRFLETDKSDPLSFQFGGDQERKRFRDFLAKPQSWNRYSYTRGNPLKYVDPDGESAELAIGAGFSFSGEAATSATASTGVGALVILSFGAGYGIGTAVNQIPGVSKGIQAGFGFILDNIYLAQNTKATLKVTNGLVAAAAKELGKISAAGGPDKDPAGNHHQREIKAMLERAANMAKRLPGKLQQQTLQAINEIAQQAGVTLE